MIFLLSLIPDADLLIPGLQHRGLTHSIIIITIVFIPAFAVYKKKALPYFAALAQHIVIGDFITSEGTQMLWPINQTWYGLGIPMASLANILLEWGSFLAAMITMIALRDMHQLLKSHLSNLLVAVPTLTVLLPSLIQFPMAVPTSLLIPHLIYLALFAASLLAIFKPILKKSR